MFSKETLRGEPPRRIRESPCSMRVSLIPSRKGKRIFFHVKIIKCSEYSFELNCREAGSPLRRDENLGRSDVFSGVAEFGVTLFELINAGAFVSRIIAISQARDRSIEARCCQRYIPLPDTRHFWASVDVRGGQLEIGTVSPEVGLPIMARYTARSVSRARAARKPATFVNVALDVIITRAINSAPLNASTRTEVDRACTPLINWRYRLALSASGCEVASSV